MVKHIAGLVVPNANAGQFYDFMIDPNDEQYRKWWPEEHFQFHIIRNGDGNHIGDRLFFDEKIGPKYRLSFHAVVLTATRPNRIVWQMIKAGIHLPAYLELRLIDSSDGVVVEHELRAGYKNFPGKILDPFIKLYLSKPFQKALEDHCMIEWPKLAEFINNKK